ncbi:MAG: hypothetical protein N3C60_09680 [Calditerrivibrio sp.]|nr:hypothetical protein [Calditerrivibrio sp.]
MDEIIEFYLDAANRIINAKNVDLSNIKGKGYFEFSNDEMLKKLLSKIFQIVRTKKITFTTTYRCDDDKYNRIFKLEIEPLIDGMLRLRHVLVSKTPRPTLLDFSRRSDLVYRMCAWCDKIFYVDRYIELDEAVNNLKLFEHNYLPMFTHGICSDCHKKLMDEIEELANS